MAFLLAQDLPPGAIDVSTDRQTPSFQSRLSRHANDLTLWVSQSTGFEELVHDPFAPSAAGPLWIVIDGYVANTSGVGPTEYIRELLRKNPDTRRLTRLRGDYTILLLAPGRDWLWLHRGATGGRTAFSSRDPNRLALSSQAHLIAALPGLSKAPDRVYLASVFGLRLVPPSGRSPYESVLELAAGDTIERADGQVQHRPQPRFEHRPAHRQSTGDWISEFGDCFETAVIETLPDDGEPCVMLSGGLDSGPVSAIAARHLARSGRRVTATSWSLTGYPSADEHQYFQRVGEWINARMRVFDADDLLPFSSVQITAETPIFNAFDPLLRACYEEARGCGSRVILTGGAGDRLYPDARWLMYDQLRRAEVGRLIESLLAGLRSRGLFRLTQYPPLRYMMRRLLLGNAPHRQAPPEWLSVSAGDAFSTVAANAATESGHPFPEYFRRLTGNWLAGLSAAENETAERYGLSRRDPFLNRDLVELMLNMPFSMTFRNGQAKWQMRRAMNQDQALPKAIIEKKRTGLLGIFFDAGFDAARPWMTSVLREQRCWRDWVNPEFVEGALSDRNNCTSQQKLVAARCVGYCLWRREVDDLKLSTPPGAPQSGPGSERRR